MRHGGWVGGGWEEKWMGRKVEEGLKDGKWKDEVSRRIAEGGAG